MSLSSFNPFALTRSEMKSIKGGQFCSCSLQGDKNSAYFEYWASTGDCANPGSGTALYYHYNNGTKQSSYVDAGHAANACYG